jgi:GNAT superfamily N-acetyltransferase
VSATVRPAELDDVPVIIEWRRQAAAWLATKGTDQWSDAGLSAEAFASRVRSSIAAGETWMAEVDEVPAATIAVDEWANPGLWTPAEQQESVIVHRMITDPKFRGHGLGGFLLDHADRVARARGKRFVRLDAWTTNTQLHAYYERLGFRLVRIVPDFTTRSAALFEREVATTQP